MAEAARYPAELQITDKGTFDGFHDPLGIPDPVLGKYLAEVVMEGAKDALGEKVVTVFLPFVEFAEQKAGKMGLPQQ